MDGNIMDILNRSTGFRHPCKVVLLYSGYPVVTFKVNQCLLKMEGENYPINKRLEFDEVQKHEDAVSTFRNQSKWFDINS
jgi:hypothetical protein